MLNTVERISKQSAERRSVCHPQKNMITRAVQTEPILCKMQNPLWHGNNGGKETNYPCQPHNIPPKDRCSICENDKIPRACTRNSKKKRAVCACVNDVSFSCESKRKSCENCQHLAEAACGIRKETKENERKLSSITGGHTPVRMHKTIRLDQSVCGVEFSQRKIYKAVNTQEETDCDHITVQHTKLQSESSVCLDPRQKHKVCHKCSRPRKQGKGRRVQLSCPKRRNPSKLSKRVHACGTDDHIPAQKKYRVERQRLPLETADYHAKTHEKLAQETEYVSKYRDGILSLFEEESGFVEAQEISDALIQKKVQRNLQIHQEKKGSRAPRQQLENEE